MNALRQAQGDKPIGLLICELVPGTVYMDRLSFMRVLVIASTVEGPHSGNPQDVTKHTLVQGWYYNPVYGVHQAMRLQDRQLVAWPPPR